METTTKPTCANCGREVTSRGPRPKTGKRYCAAPECVKERNRLAHLARTGRLGVDGRRQAPTACSNCSAPLKPREWRSGDEFGRWCSKPLCRGDRNLKREQILSGEAAEAIKTAEHLRTVVKFLGDVVMADAPDYSGSARRHCPECGLTTAIPEWPHPANPEASAACLGTLDGVEPRRIGPEGLAGGWPFRREYEPVTEEG